MPLIDPGGPPSRSPEEVHMANRNLPSRWFAALAVATAPAMSLGQYGADADAPEYGRFVLWVVFSLAVIAAIAALLFVRRRRRNGSQSSTLRGP